jgi:hypothetical protein
MRNIFMDLMYGRDEIDVTGTQYAPIFEKAGIDTKTIKLPELFWCAVEIANSLPTLEGTKFLEEVIGIGSYLMKDQKA